MNKFLTYFFFLVLLSSCGIVKKKVDEDQSNAKDIFKKDKPIEKELNSSLKIQLKKLTKNEPFFNNNTNNSGNIDFNTNFEKISSYKFTSIDNFTINQPELIFTDDNGVIYFDGKGTIFKISDDLKEIWKINHYNKKEKKLKPILYFAQNDQNLIVTDTLSKFYSINLKNGELAWSKDNISAFNSNIKIFKDRFIAIDFDNVIRCFSIKNGNEIWIFKAENSFIKSQKKLSLVLNGEVVYFINNLGDVTALNANDGSLVWQTPTQTNLIYQNAFTLENSDLVFANNSIYFSNNKNEIFSIDATSGIVNWKQTVNSSLIPTVTENLIFSVSEDGYLFIIDDLTGNIIKITNTLKNIENNKKKIKTTGFLIARNKIYLSLNNGKLIKIDNENIKQEKIYKITNSYISKPYYFNKNMYLLSKSSIIKFN